MRNIGLILITQAAMCVVSIHGALAAEPSAQEIVDRSMTNNSASWQAFPHYSFDERDCDR